MDFFVSFFYIESVLVLLIVYSLGDYSIGRCNINSEMMTFKETSIFFHSLTSIRFILHHDVSVTRITLLVKLLRGECNLAR